MNVDTEHQSATSHRPIVVAVDGSAKNRSAFDWAGGRSCTHEQGSSHRDGEFIEVRPSGALLLG